MALVRLPFQPEWRAAVLAGSKTTTCRSRRFGLAGDEFELEGARFRLVAVTQLPLPRARDEVFEDEGFASPDEFEAHWVAHHGRGWEPGRQVWVHRFIRLPGDATRPGSG